LLGAVATFFVGGAVLAATGHADLQLLLLLLIAGTSLNGMQSFLYTVGAHSYPTYLRAAGVGCSQTVSRIGGVLSTVFAGAFFALDPRPPVSYFFYAVAIGILVVVVSFFSLRTHVPANRTRGGTGGHAVPAAESSVR
jgi:AAHS family 4-hydroxybenzoate transporter-like MFS transporter